MPGTEKEVGKSNVWARGTGNLDSGQNGMKRETVNKRDRQDGSVGTMDR